MIGLILIGHAHMASEAKAAVEYILQKREYFAAVDVIDSDDASAIAEQLSVLLDDMLNTCDGVLIMADIFGATPCNIAVKTIAESSHIKHVELVAGFNLPSVIKAVLEREQMDLTLLAHACMDAGSKYMRLASQEAVVQHLFQQDKQHGEAA